MICLGLLRSMLCILNIDVKLVIEFSRFLQVMTALPTVDLDPPTISMTFGVNDSPLAGRDGTYVSVSCACILCFISSYKFPHQTWIF